MRTSDFDYPLPAERIAQAPVPRGESRLLFLGRDGSPRHHRIAQLPDLLRPGDLLVVNDTRVIPARLHARREGSGGKVELLLLERQGPRRWEVLARPAKKARPGTVLTLEPPAGPATEAAPLHAEVLGDGPEGRRIVEFSQAIEPHLDRLGHIPLPPYIRRPDNATDRERYQTIFARHPGAVAAPTAGLHFSPELVAELAGRGFPLHRVTLHVGLGTFRPVAVENLEEHVMEAERYSVPEATATALRETRLAGGRVVAVGTTVVRTLETAALDELGREGPGDGLPRSGPGVSRLFITPGFPFRVVDVLLTNFHLPRSTLLALVAAFAGRERVLAAYEEAVREGYRFYSYGDAMLLERHP